MTLLDPLYGRLEFSEHLSGLLRTPVLQRLRHVRLSNIDSLDLPGISGVTRFEHVVGASALVTHLAFAARMSPQDLLTLQAAMLLHDSAITPFGHLIEEAYNYAGTGFAHELKWTQLSEASEPIELGGADLQVYCGRRPGLREWARSAFGGGAAERLDSILSFIKGEGQYGPIVAGALDLDNIDNVVRVAFHMGINVERQLPIKLAAAIVACNSERGVVFADDALELVQKWLSLRETVYTHLMLAPHDFSGKLMLLAATVDALRSNLLLPRDWTLSDWEILGKLTTADAPTIRDTARRWLLGDLWEVSDLMWFRGAPPTYPSLRPLSEEISSRLQRPCFAYRIKDKRTRTIEVPFESGTRTRVGVTSDLWLLGVGTAKRQPFAPADNRQIVAAAEQEFRAKFVSVASSDQAREANLF